MNGENCEYCGKPLPADARSDQRFCGRICKGSARRQRRRRERIRSHLSNFPGVDASLFQSSAIDAARDAADARWRASQAAEAASRVPQMQEREWAAFERRNPGVAHPDRQRAQAERGRQERVADWQQGTARFQRTSMSIADMGRLARSRQARPTPPSRSGPPPWSGDDPDMAEPGQMIDMGNWRRGRKW